MTEKSKMFDSTPPVWELPRFRESFQCFARGCKNQAEYVAKIGRGAATIQVCLCKECRQKSLPSIVGDLVATPDKLIH
jgi:hypothetical protein